MFERWWYKTKIQKPALLSATFRRNLWCSSKTLVIALGKWTMRKTPTLGLKWLGLGLPGGESLGRSDPVQVLGPFGPCPATLWQHAIGHNVIYLIYGFDFFTCADVTVARNKTINHGKIIQLRCCLMAFWSFFASLVSFFSFGLLGAALGVRLAGAVSCLLIPANCWSMASPSAAFCALEATTPPARVRVPAAVFLPSGMSCVMETLAAWIWKGFYGIYIYMI